MKPLLSFAILVTVLFQACANAESAAAEKDSATNNAAAATTALPSAIDVTTQPQYVRCKIDGQAYEAYYADGHITGVVNALNMPRRLDFATSTDQVQVGRETLIQELQFSFYNDAKPGTLASINDFYVQGHTSFPVNGKLEYVRFKTVAGQTLNLASNDKGLLQGTFAFEVVDENNPSRKLKITDGVFKFQQEGKAEALKVNADGDVNMDSLLKEAMKQ